MTEITGSRIIVIPFLAFKTMAVWYATGTITKISNLITSCDLFFVQEKHFVSAHHPCPKPDCLAQKFVVFVSEMDLKAHMVESHGEGMSTKDLKDLRRIQADFAPAIDPGRGRGRAHRSGDRPSQQPPHSTDQQRDTPVGPFTSGSSDPPAQARRRQAFGGNLTGNGLDPTPSESVQRVPTPIQSVQRVPTPSQVDVDPLVLQ